MKTFVNGFHDLQVTLSFSSCAPYFANLSTLSIALHATVLVGMYLLDH